MIKELLEKELAKLEAELKAFDRLNNTPYLIYAVKALYKSNAALSRHIKNKDDKAYEWAKLWDRAKKHFYEQAEKQNIIDYADKRIELESKIQELRNDLFYRGRR